MFRNFKPALALAALCLACQAQAVVVTYDRIDLVDTVPGVDRVQHHYTVQGGMSLGDGLAMEFAPGLYGTIYSLDVTGPFATTIVQPDVVLDRSGLAVLDALADIPATMTFSFDVVFNRLAPLPDTQPGGYRFVDDEIGTLFQARLVRVVEPPTATVAEPAMAALSLSLLGLMAGVSRRRPGAAAPAVVPA